MAGDVGDIRFDWQRQLRTGVPEVVFAEGKSVAQLLDIATQALDRHMELFFTRVSRDHALAIKARLGKLAHHHEESNTLFIHPVSLPEARTHVRGSTLKVAVVAAGTSDMPVVAEVEQTLLYLGCDSSRYADVGVAGLWRLMEILPDLNTYPVIVAIAGMEGALFSVLGGQVKAPIIAVPTSVGYGVGKGGQVALHAALCGCSPGLAVVNIDNGFGAAVLAVKMLGIHVPEM